MEALSKKASRPQIYKEEIGSQTVRPTRAYCCLDGMHLHKVFPSAIYAYCHNQIKTEMYLFVLRRSSASKYIEWMIYINLTLQKLHVHWNTYIWIEVIEIYYEISFRPWIYSIAYWKWCQDLKMENRYEII